MLHSGTEPPRKLLTLPAMLELIIICFCSIPQQGKLEFVQAPRCAYEETLPRAH